MGIICFHNPGEENGFLSNWYPSVFQLNGIEFFSVEQFMMYRKAMCFHDADIAEQVLGTEDAARIKALGRLVSGFDDNYWSGIRQIVVYEGLTAKFSQNENLKELLMGTGREILAECAVKDLVWGIGLSMKDKKRYDRKEWRGQNLLGYTLMMVRESLDISLGTPRNSCCKHVCLNGACIMQAGTYSGENRLIKTLQKKSVNNYKNLLL